MKTAKYKLVSGGEVSVDYDPEGLCQICNFPVIEASVGGTNVCPACDCGVNRDGTPWTSSQYSQFLRKGTIPPKIDVQEYYTMRDAENKKMSKIASLCKRRGFLFPSGEIYGGLKGFYSYGPLGALLKKNIKDTGGETW